MFWIKFEKSNIQFLREVDESLTTKLLMFNFSIYTTFISKIPDLFSFPIILGFSVIFMLINIKFIGLSLIAVFLVTGILLYVISLLMLKQEVLIEYHTS